MKAFMITPSGLSVVIDGQKIKVFGAYHDMNLNIPELSTSRITGITEDGQEVIITCLAHSDIEVVEEA